MLIVPTVCTWWINALELMSYHTFIDVLYSEMNEVKRSRYRVVKTSANRSWLFPEMPEETKGES